ncbi:MAG TPA: hypothetical protein VK326_03385 [Solirubrobacterales bacterium]|nr:hypothetical protein [Solirubrobacterales bacterium]
MDVYQRRRLVALSALAAVFILLVLLVRSCGGDDEEPAPLAGPVSGASGVQGSVLTKEQYTSEADDACLQANTSLVGVDEADAQQAASDKAEILAGELSAIQSLSAPEDDANTLNSFLDALDKQVKAYEDQATAAERGDDATVAELDTTISKQASKAENAAKDYGFEVCGDTSKTDEGSATDETETTPTDTEATESDTGAVAPTTTTPAVTTTTPVAPTETAPAPSDEGGATPAAPAPAPSDSGDASSSGGVTP